jgi:hypothetical protein
MRMLVLQPSPRTDHITEDGQELQQVPYPIYANEKGVGMLGAKDVRVVGFQRRLDVQRLDVHWDEVWADPDRAVGLYVVLDQDGQWATEVAAIESATFRG